MKRLTKRIGKDAVHFDCHGTCGTCDGCTCFEIGGMVDRLAAYEDTGMEPEEIKDFVSRWKEATELAGLCKEAGIGRLRDLLDAEKELEAQK